MSATTPEQRLGNRSNTAGASPVPKFVFPPLPDRIIQIDPSGCAAWVANCNRLHAEWVDKLNVVTSGVASQIPPA